MKKLLFLILLGALTANLVYSKPLVIYGADNRVDSYEAQNPLYAELARSTAAMIDEITLRHADGEKIIINAHSTMTDNGYCPTEKFPNQPIVADCSGFLVSPTHLVTAGHCVQNQYTCDKMRWVFDYKIDRPGQNEVEIFPSNIYRCAKILKNRYTRNNDYVMIELDREVKDRAPLKVREFGRPRVGDPLVLIGHPTGLPTKIADGAHIQKLRGNFFFANLDSYGGNSGSAVFNSETGIVEGILVRGNNDFVLNKEKGCKETIHCEENGCNGAGSSLGEEVTYITNLMIH